LSERAARSPAPPDPATEDEKRLLTLALFRRTFDAIQQPGLTMNHLERAVADGRAKPSGESQRFFIGKLLLTGVFILVLITSISVFARENNVQPSHIVWWGKDDFWKNRYSDHTNGLIECGDEFVTNAVAIAGTTWSGLVMKSDGTVQVVGHNTFGAMDVPPGLSNVVSFSATVGCYWAIRRDGRVAGWGNDFQEHDGARVAAGLSNVVSIIEVCDNCVSGWHLASRKDGTVVGFRLDNPELRLPLVKVHGEVLSNVVALASMEMTPLVLKRNGVVYRLGYQTPGVPPAAPKYTKVDETTLQIDYGGESANLPYQYTTAEPMVVNGQPLTNVVAIAGGDGTQLALKRDGTVVGWGITSDGPPPSGLSNVVAIAATGHQSLALKQDGTVVAWGANYAHQLSVPAGLSNVVAIATAGDFNLAITTGIIPASVFIQPHGRLEEMEQKADLVFKGQAILSAEITNASFTVSSLGMEATKFKVISVLKGEAPAEIIFNHYASYGKHEFFWSGPSPPAMHKFEAGQSYLVFAMRMDKADAYYAPPASATNMAGVFRQIADVPKRGPNGVMHTLDARPLGKFSVKEAHWKELNRLLNDSSPSNALYAINLLDHMSLKGEQYEEWLRSGDFKRARILSVMRPLIKSKNEQVAIRALECFETGTNAPVLLAPFTNQLIIAANKSQTSSRRLAAIRALSALDGDSVTNSLVQLLGDKDENIRAGAVVLLPRFQPAFTEQLLRTCAGDLSPKVRAAVADTIGSEKIVTLVPILEKFWNDTNNVHTSAGKALMSFDIGQVSDLLKAHLSAEDFHASYLCKLAENNPQPWVTNLVDVLKLRREANWKQAVASGIKETTNYFNALMALSGDNFKCWNIIHDYLAKLPAAEFQDHKLDWCLDVLEDAGNTGSREPVMLYELYKKKGLNERAIKFRQANGKCSGFNVTIYFDNVDKQNPN
jgi:hypothetical protein